MSWGISNMKKNIKWAKKDLIGLEGLSPDEIRLILDTSSSFKEISERPIKKVPALRGKTIAHLFLEPSTRTRISFELAAKRLSADTIGVSGSSSSILKGETIKDTAKNIEAMKVDMIIMRHSSSGAPYLLSKAVSASVINAGDGAHAHPTQALLDMFTIKEKKGSISGLRVSIIGDIAHSRVARSNIWGLVKLGAHVTVCGPKTLIPVEIEKMGVKVTYDIKEAKSRLTEKWNIVCNSAGVFVYSGIGLLCLILGANFLDYSVLSKILPVGPEEARALGILGVEIGVEITVASCLVSIFLDLVSRGEHEEALK